MSNIANFLSKLGLEKPKSQAVFYKNGIKKFGKKFEEVMWIIEARADGADVDPYAAKNDSLALSLYVGSYFSYQKWEAIFSWLERERLVQPKRVLDLGCECGVTTCLLALLWPEAEIVGVDLSSKAIACAQELSRLSSISNVRFISSIAEEALENTGPYDVVFASFFSHEWLRIDGSSPLISRVVPERLETTSLLEEDSIFVEKLNLIEKALTPNGIFISIDRIPYTSGLWWYVQAIEAANMKLSLSHSYRIEIVGTSGKEHFPVNVARSSQGSHTYTTSTEVLSLACFRDVPPLGLDGDVADAFFRSFLKEECLFESTIKYLDGSGTRHIFLYKSGALLLRYDWTNKGFKNLITIPFVSLPEAIQGCRDTVDGLIDVAAVVATITDPALIILKDWGFEIEGYCRVDTTAGTDGV